MQERDSSGPKKNFSRRTLLKLPFLAAAGGIIGYESEHVVWPSIHTKHAIYHPVYDRHDNPAWIKSMPSNFDALFLEGVVLSEFPSRKPEDIITFYINQGSEKAKYVQSLLNQGEVAIIPEAFVMRREVAEQVTTLDDKKLAIGALGTFLAIYSHFLHKHLFNGADLPRRRFFTKLGAAVAGLFATNEVVTEATYALYDIRNPSSEARAAQHIATRLHTLTHYATIDNKTRLFRDMFMANKLLIAGEKLAAIKERPVETPYIVGAAHGGVADFIKLGRAACRFGMVNFPGIEEIVHDNGGVEQLAQVPILYGEGQNIKTQNFQDEELVRDLRAKGYR